jgi:predicted amidophosphoribosyltransferase
MRIRPFQWLVPLLLCPACRKPASAGALPWCQSCWESRVLCPPICSECGGIGCPIDGQCLRPWLRFADWLPHCPTLICQYLLVGPGYRLLRSWKTRPGELSQRRILESLEPDLFQNLALTEKTAWVPVPQSAKRSWQLGHHPARELAHAFAALAGGRPEALLAINAQGPAAAPLPRQAALSQPERLARRFGFSLSHDAALEQLPDHAIVVDDFLTTGSTALAAAWLLHQAGVSRIDFAFLGFRPGRLDPLQPEPALSGSTTLPERKLPQSAVDPASG